MGITLVQEGEDYSSFYDTGCIIYQSVNEGTMIGEGTKIGVKVSLGLTEEEMPNVVGKSENAAIEAITRLVGDVAEIRYVHDADAKPSEVTSRSRKPVLLLRQRACHYSDHQQGMTRIPMLPYPML